MLRPIKAEPLAPSRDQRIVSTPHDATMSIEPSPTPPPTAAPPDRFIRNLRLTALLCGLASTAFWIYTFYFIAQVPPGDGTGFQWIAEMPLTMIWLFLAFPAVSLSLSKRMAAIAAGLGIASLIANAILWAQLLTEFAGTK